jgi:dinuclear metal center YbgI/SA1388 family protein
MKLADLVLHLETVAPPQCQESYDNSGLIVGDPQMPIQGILCCLDVTEAVLDEAIERGCNIVVAHHPIIFFGLKQLTGANYVERCVLKAIRAGLAIVAVHTNLDKLLRQGVSSRAAELLGLQNIRLLASEGEVKSHSGELLDIGLGVVGELPAPTDEHSFLRQLKTTFDVACIRHTPLLGKPLLRVAFCGGSGASFRFHALAAGADVFVTADFKYHEFFDADGRMLIADIGHFESEQHTIELLREIISEKFANFAPYCTTVNTNPVHYT